MIARRAILSGRVQGVGFRFFAERAARAVGVKGWVRNLPNGAVETEVEGDEGDLERYFERLRQGPMGSRVTSMEISETEPRHYDSFEITR